MGLHPFQSVNLTQFSPDLEEKIENCADRNILDLIPSIVTSENFIFAFEIEAEFNTLSLEYGKSGKGELGNAQGKVIGFFYPQFLENIVAGPQLFFIGKSGADSGKILNSKTKSMHVFMRQISTLNAGLPLKFSKCLEKRKI